MNRCQHCGTEIENPRAKNCKTCAAILAEANRRGSYSFVMEAIARAKAGGVTGAEMHAEMRAAHAAGTADKNKFWNDFRERQARREAERKARKTEGVAVADWDTQEYMIHR